MPPLVSVVTPTRDRRGMLRATLATVLGQRDVDLEVVVVDDGSSTAPAHLPQDRRVTLLRREASSGVAEARNAGLAAVRGPYIAFTDDDDLWAPDELSSQLRAMERTCASGSSCGVVVVDNELRIQNNQRASQTGDVGTASSPRTSCPAAPASWPTRRSSGGWAASTPPSTWWPTGTSGSASAGPPPWSPSTGRCSCTACTPAACRGATSRPTARSGRWRQNAQPSGPRGGWRWTGRAWSTGWPTASSGAATGSVRRFGNRRWGRRVPAEWRDEVEAWLLPETDPEELLEAVTSPSPSPTSGGTARRPDPSRLGAG